MVTLSKPEEFGAIIVSQKGNDIIRLRDVADVNVGAEDERTMARWNGQLAVGLGIVKQSKASTVDVAAEIRSVLPELSKLLPEGMKLEVAFDSSEFINESISEVEQTLIIALVLVVLVVLAFLEKFSCNNYSYIGNTNFNYWCFSSSLFCRIYN